MYTLKFEECGSNSPRVLFFLARVFGWTLATHTVRGQNSPHVATDFHGQSSTSHTGAWLVPSKFPAFLLFSLYPPGPHPAYSWHHISSSDHASPPEYSDSPHHLLSDVQSLWCKIHGSIYHSLFISLYTPFHALQSITLCRFLLLCFAGLQHSVIYLRYSKALVSFNPG